MKGKEIIKYIHGVPDFEQIREKCLEQPVRKRRVRLSVIAAAVAALLVFATGVYAGGVLLGNRFDMGGIIEWVFVDEDSPEILAWEARTYHIRPIYVNENANIPYALLQGQLSTITWFSVFDPETAHAINEMAEGQVFTANGEPFVLMVPEPGSARYTVAGAGKTLFNAAGEEIGRIFFGETSSGESTILKIESRASLEAWNDYSATYEDAARFLGRDFRIPTIEIYGFSPPGFRIDDVFWKRVSIQMLPICDEDFWSKIGLIVEVPRDESDEPRTRYFAGEITELEIAGTPVFRFTSYRRVPQYRWIYDGLIYSLYPGVSPGFDFCEYQALEIIKSMLE